MASIDDVVRQTNLLLDALIRMAPFDGNTGMGQAGAFPGLVPSTYALARAARDTSTESLKVVKETRDLLNAVNVETLGRIEALLNAVNVETLGRIEALLNSVNVETLGRIEASLSVLNQVAVSSIEPLLHTINEKTLDRIENRIKGNEQTLGRMETDIKQDVTDLNAKLDALNAAVHALSQKP